MHKSMHMVMYRDWLKSMRKVLWMLQAKWGRSDKQQKEKIHQTWSTHFSQYLYKRTLGRTIPLVISRLNIQDEDLVSPRPCGLTNRGKAGNHHPILFFFCPPHPLPSSSFSFPTLVSPNFNCLLQPSNRPTPTLLHPHSIQERKVNQLSLGLSG